MTTRGAGAWSVSWFDAHAEDPVDPRSAGALLAHVAGRCSQLVPLLWGSDHVGLGAGGQSVEVVCRFGSFGDPNLWRSSLPTSMNVASRPTTG